MINAKWRLYEPVSTPPAENIKEAQLIGILRHSAGVSEIKTKIDCLIRRSCGASAGFEFAARKFLFQYFQLRRIFIRGAA